MISYEEMDNKYDSLEPFYVEPQKKYEIINRATEQLDGSTFHNEPGEETVNGITNYASILPTYIQPVEKYETLNPQKVELETKYHNRQTQKNGENLSYPIPGLEDVKYDEIEQHDQHLHSIDKQFVTEGRENPEVPNDYTYIGNKNIYEDLDNIEISYSMLDAENAHSSNSEHKITKNDVNISTIERNLKDKKEFIKITITKKTCLAVSIPLALVFLLVLIGGMVYYFYFINDSTSETNTDFPINITTQETTIMSLPSSSTDDLETTTQIAVMPLPTNIIDTPCINITCKNNGSCHERDIGSVCECPVGFEGTFCEIDIDECASSPCQNGGTCLDKINGYECSCVICECADKEAGPNCEVEVPCTASLCQNGGSCDANTVGKCICIDGYVGQFCEMVRKTCQNITCANGGTCIDDDTEMDAVCSCAELFKGVYCETKINPCDSDPCLNGSTCVRGGGLNYTCLCGYSCQCANEYDGNCAKNLNSCNGLSIGSHPHPTDCSMYISCNFGTLTEVDCNSNPNNNNRLVYDPVLNVCNFPSNVPCADADIATAPPPTTTAAPCNQSLCINGMCGTIDPSRCDCDEGFAGEFCDRVRITCENISCENEGTCEDVDQTKDAYCLCVETYEGATCGSEINPCDSQPCMNNGICTPGPQLNYTCECTYSCSCANDPSYAGDNCEKDLNTCVGKPNKYQVYAHNCSKFLACWDGAGPLWDCLIAGEVFNPAIGWCEATVPCYTAPEINPCDSGPCLNGGVCTQIEGLNYTCQCTYNCSCANDHAYAGEKCEKDLRTCAPTYRGTQVNPDDCTKYANCWDGALAPVTCAMNKVFDPQGFCADKDQVTCYLETP